ncbi:hypothetical protein FNAPI_10584 [Fusarium napiforme]|uniref:Uncharacterized protein n=1 Tax=Fusarium napiforme TaxID=42672 RepID=A0A8H5MRW5_9HYPO|nr:hypothetical protein FNAPI_10584 [Fusarium napiforme]
MSFKLGKLLEYGGEPYTWDVEDARSWQLMMGSNFGACLHHDIDDKSLAPYSQTVDDAAWIYNPLDDNETITEIWWGSIGGNGDTMGDLFFQYRSGTLFKETSIKSIFKWEWKNTSRSATCKLVIIVGLQDDPQKDSLAHIHVLEDGYGGPESLVPNAASLYTPFDNGETVSEVWVRITQNVVGGLGSAQAKAGKYVMFMQLASTRPHGSWLTFPEDQRGQYTTGVMPHLRYCVEDFFGGSVDLVGVVEVTCCRLEHKPEVISGMLFRFAGGRREALGGVRLCGLQQPRYASRGQGREAMYFEFEYDHTGVVSEHPNLFDARFTMFHEPPEDLNPENHPNRGP